MFPQGPSTQNQSLQNNSYNDESQSILFGQAQPNHTSQPQPGQNSQQVYPMQPPSMLDPAMTPAMMNPAMMNPAMMNPAMMDPAMMTPGMMNPAMLMSPSWNAMMIQTGMTINDMMLLSTQQQGMLQMAMLNPIMPISQNANPLFPWTENIHYFSDQPVTILPGQPVSDTLENVQLPYFSKPPINIQEFKENQATKQGIPLPKYSITEFAQMYKNKQTLPSQAFFLQKQLKLTNLLLPASGHNQPITFWCPVCDQINDTELVENGCCCSKVMNTKDIRKEETQWDKDKYFFLCTLIFPHMFLACSCIFLIYELSRKNVKVHVCPSCKRMVGTELLNHGVPPIVGARVHHRRGRHGHRRGRRGHR